MVPEIEKSRTYNLRTSVILAWMRILEQKILVQQFFMENPLQLYNNYLSSFTKKRSFEKTSILKDFSHIQGRRYRYHVFDDIFEQTARRRPKIST